nr:hypothetical protein [uncultured Dyadobacter sp.]
MQSEFYTFQSDDSQVYFTFESVSRKKTIRKIVMFTPFEDNELIYNLALLDILLDGQWSDDVKSHNFDLSKVMATTIRCIFEFIESHPNCSVYFKGNSAAKTRLYRIVIARQLPEIKEYFEIYGIRNEQPESFRIGMAYDAFILKPVQI